MALRIAVASCLASGAAAHGIMVVPQSRQPGAPSLDIAGQSCDSDSCWWFSNFMAIPGNATICDPELITSNPGVAPCTAADPFGSSPWRAPGTSPILSPCGVKGGELPPLSPDAGADGIDLPPTASPLKWVRGTAVEVALSVQANHGGGYNYRLCPADVPTTEACFQTHHLAFEGNTTTVRFVDGRTLEIPAVRTVRGTTPAGSQWTRNPIPVGSAFPTPFPTNQTDWAWDYSLMDRVMIPASLPLGPYVVSWRWDCELTPEIWTNCGDVVIVDAPSLVLV